MTLTDLKVAVLRELRIIAAGEDAPAEYVEIVGARYAALYDMLLTKGLVSWTSTAEVPEYAEMPLIAMLAYLCAGPFGINPVRKAELKLAGALDLSPAEGGPSLAERQLRRQLAKNYVSYPAQSEYF